MSNIIEVENLVKTYHLYGSNSKRIKALFYPKNKSKEQIHYALNGINFSLQKGKTLGFIGLNGSGKSTLSNIIAGLIPETSGEIKINGTVSLLAISAGLNNELTGRENIRLKCLLLGFSRKEVRKVEDEIIDFSELEEFIDQPVKKYSSGMKSRLGFSISISVDPDIFIIDEALSVGDSGFTIKCLNKLREFTKQGKSIIFISHSISQMKEFCDDIIWLETGRVKAYGNKEKVLYHYEKFVRYWRTLNSNDKKEYLKIAATIPVYKKIIEDDFVLFDLPTQKFDWYNATNKPFENSKKIQFVSKLCRIKSKSAKRWQSLDDLNLYFDCEKLTGKVYHCKKQVTIYGHTYCLLSTSESYNNELIGWIEQVDLNLLNYITISKDKFERVLLGKGSSFTKPWGGVNQIAEKLLNKRENAIIIIDETVLIGKTIWYKTKIENKVVWINSNQTKQI